MKTVPGELGQPAGMALEAASGATTDEAPADHLNLAAANPHQPEPASGRRNQTRDEAALAQKLQVLLTDADRGGFGRAAIHINSAIIDLGGSGTPSPGPALPA